MNKMIDVLQQVSVIAACVLIVVIGIRLSRQPEPEPVACFSRGVMLHGDVMRELVNRELILMDHPVEVLE